MKKHPREYHRFFGCPIVSVQQRLTASTWSTLETMKGVPLSPTSFDFSSGEKKGLMCIYSHKETISNAHLPSSNDQPTIDLQVCRFPTLTFSKCDQNNPESITVHRFFVCPGVCRQQVAHGSLMINWSTVPETTKGVSPFHSFDFSKGLTKVSHEPFVCAMRRLCQMPLCLAINYPLIYKSVLSRTLTFQSGDLSSSFLL